MNYITSNRKYCKTVDFTKKRFHSHQARIYDYTLEDGVKQTEFWSYSTPMIVQVDGELYMNKKWYSSSTTRQVNRYCREYGINTSRAIKLDEYEIRALCR